MLIFGAKIQMFTIQNLEVYFVNFVSIFVVRFLVFPYCAYLYFTGVKERESHTLEVKVFFSRNFLLQHSTHVPPSVQNYSFGPIN